MSGLWFRFDVFFSRILTRCSFVKFYGTLWEQWNIKEIQCETRCGQNERTKESTAQCITVKKDMYKLKQDCSTPKTKAITKLCPKTDSCGNHDISNSIHTCKIMAVTSIQNEQNSCHHSLQLYTSVFTPTSFFLIQNMLDCFIWDGLRFS